MSNHNLNDPENKMNDKRLMQDDARRRNDNSTNGMIAGIALVLVLIAIIAFSYFANNKVVRGSVIEAGQPASVANAAAPSNATTNNPKSAEMKTSTTNERSNRANDNVTNPDADTPTKSMGASDNKVSSVKGAITSAP